MNILVRLPNWLGDVVMSTGFLQALTAVYPQSCIDVIIKESLKEMVPLLPGISDHLVFSKRDFKGIKGAIRFGRTCAARKSYDLFFSLPDSFSSALSGYFTKSVKRIGYAAEMRSLLLTNAYKKPLSLHRAEEYITLLKKFRSVSNIDCKVGLKVPNTYDNQIISNLNLPNNLKIVINIHSAAQSRRIPLSKSVSICKMLINTFNCSLLFTGTESEKEYTHSVISEIKSSDHCIDLSGKIDLVSLAQLCSLSDVVLSSDSGIAHIANAVGTHVVVLFGAGNEKNTAPYNSDKCTIVRADGISCAPCVSNTCRYGHVNCMNHIDEKKVIELVKNLLVKRDEK
jgi:lipopolysaccharide heptosyltransferase II